MNRFYFTFVNLTVLLFAGLAYSGETDSSIPNPYVITYPFKSTVIHYTIKNEYGHGKISKGTEVVYIKGDRLVKVTKMAIPYPEGTTKNVETLQFFTPEYVYMIDLIKKTGIKVNNPRKYTKPAYDKLSDNEKRAFHERMDKRGIVSLDLRGLGKKVGEEIILGKKCDVYEVGEKIKPEELSVGETDKVYIKNWIWRGASIRLKTIKEGVGWTSKLISTKIEENAKIPDSRFMVPSDVKITYDEEKSEFAKQRALARFHLYKTGKSIPIKVKLKKRVITPGKASKRSKSGQKSQEKKTKGETNKPAEE